MKKFRILESTSVDGSLLGENFGNKFLFGEKLGNGFLLSVPCLSGEVVIKNKNQNVDDLFSGIGGGCRNDYFVAMLRLMLIDEYVREFGIIDFDFIGIGDDFFVSHDGIAVGNLIDSEFGEGFRGYSFNLVDVINGCGVNKNGSFKNVGLMVGDLRFGCLEQFIIGCLGGGYNISGNYWSKFRKFLVVNNLILCGGGGVYCGFNYERISEIFFNSGGDSFDVEFGLNEFFSYGLRDNVANSFNWKVGVVEESFGKRKMVFECNPYMNIVTGEVYFDSFDKLRSDFVGGLISEGDFIERNINYGGTCKNFVNGLRALQVDDFAIRNGFDIDLVDKFSTIRNRMVVKNYISYQMIADLLGYANKMGAWYMMQNQCMVVLRNDRIEFAANAGVMDVVKTFGLGICEVLSESDMVKKTKKNLKKNSKVLLKEDKIDSDSKDSDSKDSDSKDSDSKDSDSKDSGEEDLDGGLLVDFVSGDLPILPNFGKSILQDSLVNKTLEFVEEKLESFSKELISGMDLLNLQISETVSIGNLSESFTVKKSENKSVNSDDFQQILNLSSGDDEIFEVSELDVFKFENDEIPGADEKVVYYDMDEELTLVEFLWLKDIFGDVVIGMSHPERNELFRCMMKNDKDIFGSFRVKRYLYDDLVENSLWKKAYDAEVFERIKVFKNSGQYFRWNLEFLNFGCLESKGLIDNEMSKIVMDSLNKQYFGIGGSVIERKVLKKKMVSEFGIFELVNRLMREISVIGIENFRKSRGLGCDFVENLKRDFVGDFNDLLGKMYLPCRVFKNKRGNLEVNYISSIRKIGHISEIKKIGNRNSVRNVDSFDKENLVNSQIFLDKEKYTRIVRNLTETVYKNNYELLNPLNLERSVIDSDFTCQLDHKYSIDNGFENGVCPSVIASVENLEVLPVRFNQIKGVKNSISLNCLQMSIKERFEFA